jgi:hypothetical protein
MGKSLLGFDFQCDVDVVVVVVVGEMLVGWEKWKSDPRARGHARPYIPSTRPRRGLAD